MSNKGNVINADFSNKKPVPGNQPISENAKSNIVLYIGLVLFLLNLSFVMIYSIFPAYLMTLGYSQTKIGALEGVFELISQLMKVGSGFIIDILKQKKLLMFIGCGIIFSGRAMVAFSSNFIGIILGRAFDRIGNGVYSVPRDYLVAAAATKENRGQSFGLVKSLGQLGPVIGGIVAALLMKKLGFGFRDVFVCAVIPPLIVLLIVAYKIKEIPIDKKSAEKSFQLSDLKKLGLNFLLLMGIHFIFSLGRCSESFMGIYAIKNFNLSYENVPYVMVIFNLSWSCFSYPAGVLADKVGRFIVLAFGIVSLLVADLLFYNASTLFEFFAGVIFWGMQMSIMTNTFLALIVDSVPPSLRGTAFGLYCLISAICLFTADFLGGYIGDVYGNVYIYLYSSVWGALSLIALMIIMKYRDLTHQY